MAAPIAPKRIDKNDEEDPGYLERAVLWAAHTIFRVAKRDPEEAFRNKLIKEIRNQTLCPTILRRQFDHYVPKAERKTAFETLGQKQTLSRCDYLLNWIWRDAISIRRRYEELGKEAAAQDPYLLALALEKALIKDSSCRCK